MGEVYGLAAASLRRRRSRSGRERARRAGEGDRGCRARHGEHLSRSRSSTLPDTLPIAGERIARQFADLLARIMPFDLVIDERDGERRGGARVEDERVRELGRDRRRAALLRRPLGHSARGDRGNADPDRPDQAVRDARAAGARVRSAPQALAARAAQPDHVLRLRAGARRGADRGVPAGAGGTRRARCSRKRSRAARRGIRR